MNLLGLARQVVIFFYEVIKFLCWLLPLLFFSFLALSFFLSYLFPDFPIKFVETTVLSLRNFELGVILLLMFVLTILGIYFRQREKKIVVKFLIFKSRDEIIVALITSFFFSTFFIKSFFEFKKLESILIIFLTFFFFILLPQFLLFYSFIDLSFFKKLISSSIETRPSLSEIKQFSQLIYPSYSGLQPERAKKLIRWVYTESVLSYRSIMRFARKTVLTLMRIAFFIFILLFSALIFKKLFTLIFNAFLESKFVLIILFSFILFYFGYLVGFYIFTFLGHLKKLIINYSKKIYEKKEYLIRVIVFSWRFIKMTAIGFAIISLFIIIVVIVVAFLTWQLNRYADYQRRLRENLTIMSVVPATTTLAQKVRLEGYNFGWKVNKADKLMSNYGKVVVDEWKGEELIFIVPLHWKEGIIKLWIERNKDDLPEGKLIKSNIVRLKILSRWDFFPAEEELRNKNPLSYLKRAVKKIRRTLFLKAPYFP